MIFLGLISGTSMDGVDAVGSDAQDGKVPLRLQQGAQTPQSYRVIIRE